MMASALQAVTGFGFALIATPLLLVVVPAKVAVPTIMCVSLSCLILLSMKARNYTHVPTVKWLTMGSVFGIPAGAYMLTHANPQSMKLLASIVTLVIAIYFVLKPAHRGASVPPPWFCILVGAVSGFLSTSVSMPGPPVVLALSNAGMAKREFRATGSMFFVIVYTVSAITLAVSGVLTLSVLLMVASLVPVAILGNRLGDKLFDWIPQPIFDKAVPLLLMLTAINNVVRR